MDDPARLLEGRTRETAIRRDAAGRWWNGEDRIAHPNLVRAFDSWIEVADDGRYCLKNDINWAYVAIEGAPLFVRGVTVNDGSVSLLLSDGTTEPLVPKTLRQDRDGILYCDARGTTMAARFDRGAMQGLEGLLEEDDDGVFLRIGTETVRPPTVDDPLQSE